MRLTEKQQELLAAIEFRAAEPAHVTGKLVRMREYTVQYQIRRLRVLGVIDLPRPVIDMHRLGFTHYFFYAACREEKGAGREQFVRFLEASGYVTWIFEVGAQYHIAFTISVRNAGEVSRFLDAIATRFGNIVGARALCAQVQFQYLGRRYLGTKNIPRLPWQFTVGNAELTITPEENKILRLLASASDPTVRSIARELGMPVATVERRIQKLEQDKIILGYYYWIDAQVFNRSSFIVTIKLHHIEPNFWSDLLSWVKEVQDVIYVVQTLGPWDYELLVEVAQQENIGGVSQALYRRFGEKIEALQTIPILKTHKIRSYP